MGPCRECQMHSGFISKSVARRSREVIFALYLVLLKKCDTSKSNKGSLTAVCNFVGAYGVEGAICFSRCAQQ